MDRKDNKRWNTAQNQVQTATTTKSSEATVILSRPRLKEQHTGKSIFVENFRGTPKKEDELGTQTL